ncbi:MULTISPECIES: hypothetical protein [unclassified Enterococcus]|uniref:hypothetical protein n=1 Tax=unclassified Enterococcus TaxID=2608891 RepID=UPI001CE12C63|nr:MULTISPECIES: hypothetical protein [unclassified Enterococcus]MCA5012123.1 hypothetical protein [Enterococcus sp. S23]MCA5015374.1 hypothetical protein [Enterococcus sp. S22(2020)]
MSERQLKNTWNKRWGIISVLSIAILGIAAGCQNQKVDQVTKETASSENSTVSSQSTAQTSSSLSSTSAESTSTLESSEQTSETTMAASETSAPVESQASQPEIIENPVTEEEVTAFYSKYNRSDYARALELVTRLYGFDPESVEDQQYIHGNLMTIGQPVPNGEFPETSTGSVMGGMAGSLVYKGSPEYDDQMGTNFSGQYPENIFAKAY